MNGFHKTNQVKRWSVNAATIIIRIYQLTISPLIGPVCRFQPSCSQYAIEALKRYGMIKGAELAIKRLLRCHPWNPGGFDPVP